MEYGNVDEETRKKAYEQVQKIAKAILNIRKKYYLCFNKISDVDKQRYDNLIAQMQDIAKENGISKSSAQLMADINDEYSDNSPNLAEENKNSMNSMYKRYIRALQFLAEITSLFKNSTDKKAETAYLKKAQQVQNEIKKMCNALKTFYSEKKLTSDRRIVFSEMLNQQSKTYFGNLLKTCYEKVRGKTSLALKEGQETIKSCEKSERSTQISSEISLA